MFIRFLKFIPLILAALFALTSVPLAAYEKPQKITLVGARGPEDVQVQWMLAIYREAFLEHGISVDFLDVPPVRAIKLAKLGHVDGDVSRVSSFSSFHPELVAVREPIAKVVFVAFTTDANIHLNNWDSLAERDYRVECQLGIKLCENKVSAALDGGSLASSKSIAKAVEKLLKGRADIYIENRILFYKALHAKFGKAAKDNVFEAGTMEEVTIHLHLHNKHTQLAELISNTLKRMKAQGRFEFYRKKYKIDRIW